MSIRTILLEICQRAGLDARMGYESGASAFLSAAGSRPCAYVSYSLDAVTAAGYDTASVYFGGSDPAAARARVEGLLDRSLDVSSLREMGGEWLSFVITARAKRRIYNVMGLGGSPTPPTPTADYMYFEAAEANSTVSMISTLTTAPDLEYSTDGQTWQEWQHTTTTEDEMTIHTFDTLTLTAIGDRVYLRGDNPNGLATGHDEGPEFASVFALSGKLSGGGKMVSILDKTMQMSVLPDFAFAALFSDPMGEATDTLLTAPSLSGITAIGFAACVSMFAGQTALVAASNMEDVVSIGFSGCDKMYMGCTAITSAASMPLLTTIGSDGCSQMYEDCTFAMSDNGTDLNFDFPTPPVTAGETTYATAYDLADWMGNTSGFTNP